MKDKDKTKTQLITELAEMRQRLADLEAAENNQRQAKEVLRENEERYRTLFDGVPVGLYRTTPAGEILDVNPAMVQLLGYPDQETLLTTNAAELHLNAETRRQWQALIEREGVVHDFEAQLRQHDGTVIWVRDTARVVHDADGKVLYYEGSLEDITERVRAEEALRANEEKYRTILENIEDGYYEVDIAGNFTFFNDSMCRIIGYPRSEMMGMNNRQYMDEANARKVLQAFNQIYTTGEPAGGFSWELIRKNGEKRNVEVSVSLIRNSEGEPIGFRGVARDITERVRAERTLRQQERMAAVGQLAAGVAHDFNNLLTSIIGFAELVQMNPDTPRSAQPDLARIVKQAQRAAHLVQQILDFSRKSIRQPQSLNLVPFLKEAARFLERTIPENIHILLEIEPVERLVHADLTQLQQMLTNLAVNARDAMPAGGELRLRLSQLTLKPGEQPPSLELPPGEWMVLSVSDTGTGMPAEVLPHIFEPFFTTRMPEGSGLGLAQVYGIVKQHEGYIDVESEMGKGSTFTIYLPAIAVGEEATEGETPGEIPRGHGETILLVEDESAVLEAGKTMLEHLGYRVLTAINGQQALDIYAEHQNEIALVLADVVMPKMDGVALFRALKIQNSDIKAVMMTGYPLGDEAQRVLAQGIADWLQKPITLAHLAQVISRALQSPGR